MLIHYTTVPYRIYIIKTQTCQCKNCEKSFEKTVKEIKRSKTGKHFCSRRCSTIFNNIDCPKRKPEGKCYYCNCLLSKAKKYCDRCFNNDLLKKDIFSHSTIRNNARSKAKELGWKSCKYCGYDKHIQICHIKPVKDFPKDSLISEVNHIDNLLPLCPNCHWEFDHNIINLEDINK